MQTNRIQTGNLIGLFPLTKLRALLQLAIKCGIDMPDSKIEKVSGRHHTFFTKRFDREQKHRIHFASAMTMTDHGENDLRDNPASYLEIAEFIQFHGLLSPHVRQLL